MITPEGLPILTIKLAKEHEISLAISNPCFELWPYLHVAGHGSHITSEAIQKKLGLKLGGDPKRPDGGKLKGKYGQARERAMQLSCNHELAGKEGGENPSTEVWKLVDELLATGTLREVQLMRRAYDNYLGMVVLVARDLEGKEK